MNTITAKDVLELVNEGPAEDAFMDFANAKYGDKWLDFSDEQMASLKAEFAASLDKEGK